MTCSAALRLDMPLPPGGNDRGRLRQVQTPRRVVETVSNANNDEELRWAEYRLLLHCRASNSAQLRTVEAIWRNARKKYRGLRYPSMGCDDDGVYHLTWAFDDLPDTTFAVEVAPDGLVSWFFRDRTAGVTEGNDDDGEVSLPDSAYTYLERFAR